MSTKYEVGEDVPSSILCARLNVLSNAVTKGRKGIDREFYMSIPAQCDNDADLVISSAARRIIKLEGAIACFCREELGNMIFESDQEAVDYILEFLDS